MKNLTSKQKRELEDKAVLTDWDAIIDKKIERRVGKTEKIVVIENEKTRAVIHEQTDLIKELKKLCEEVMKDMTDNESNDKAKELLPVQSGFFFGTYEYDEWYYNGIEETIAIINKCLSLPNDKCEFYYRASW